MSLPEKSQDVLSYTHGRTTAVPRRSLLDRSCDSPPAATARKGTGSRLVEVVEEGSADQPPGMSAAIGHEACKREVRVE
jgi:hypothetical protein